MSKISLGVLSLFCAALVSATSGIAQQAAFAHPGPVPTAITAAKSLFISNAGADSGLFPEPFSGDPSRGYSEFYQNLKATGQWQLVNDPSQADLVLELQLTAPNGPSKGSKVNGASDPVPMFRLVVFDRKTHYVLWAMTESIDTAYRQKTHDKNFDDALSDIVTDFEGVSGKVQGAAH